MQDSWDNFIADTLLASRTNSMIGHNISEENMSEEARKAYANKMAMVQEEELVRQEKDKGHLAWRVAKEYDVLVIVTGEMWLVDCKRASRDELECFIIDNYDVVKILDVAKNIGNSLGITVRCKFDMWFAKTRTPNNRRYIDISEDDRQWSIRCWKTANGISTKRVVKGNSEERE
jgi:hypothetical protein